MLHRTTFPTNRDSFEMPEGDSPRDQSGQKWVCLMLLQVDYLLIDEISYSSPDIVSPTVNEFIDKQPCVF